MFWAPQALFCTPAVSALLCGAWSPPPQLPPHAVGLSPALLGTGAQ